MGMSTYVQFIKAPDKKWKKMKKVWDACDVAGVNPPDEVLDYFEHEAPDDRGVIMDARPELEQGDGRESWVIAVADISKDVTHIRFTNSW